ncbi:hypothetical protein ACGFNU_00205 [Spirillospora sp. NPDC048911]|uniref:hypothetical protein n=1 Tax=Spirillospora sp. NPDC048911 TaxID=3364527 RepID=UPI00371D9A9B
MTVTTNVPVLVGPVPLLYVQSMTVMEGFEIERINGSRFLHATRPTRKQIGIEAMLIGPRRLAVKKSLEALALVSRELLREELPASVPVVSGLTISLDMQITELNFTQSVARRDALDVSISLIEVPRAGLAALVGQAAELAVAAGTALVPGAVPPNPISRTVLDAF